MIDPRPMDAPAWSRAADQLASLQRDLKIDPGVRDGELTDAFKAVLRRLDGSKGLLRRSLVPAVVRHVLPRNCSRLTLRLPPVIQIIGFERCTADGWAEIEDVRHTLDNGVLGWTRTGAWTAEVRVVYHAGYVDGDADLDLIVPALRLMVRQMVDGHDDRVQKSIDALLAGLQVYG